MKKLTNQERMKRLIENHEKYLSMISLNFANQFHQLARELERESTSFTQKTNKTNGEEIKEEVYNNHFTQDNLK